MGALLQNNSFVSGGISSWAHTDAWSVECSYQQKEEGKKAVLRGGGRGGSTDFRLFTADCEMAPQRFSSPQHPIWGAVSSLLLPPLSCSLPQGELQKPAYAVASQPTSGEENFSYWINLLTSSILAPPPDLTPGRARERRQSSGEVRRRW